MIKIDKVSVMNIENALRGARNPMSSWDKSDSFYDEEGKFVVGEKDLTLATKLCKAGSDHRKFMRQIFVSMDILAPLYWWKEFDTYKVGTVANSTSTMHKIHAKEFVMEDFSTDKMSLVAVEHMRYTVNLLEMLRQDFILAKCEVDRKKHWYDMIQLLPTSYNQLKTVTMTYENLINMHTNRKNHKLNEWREFTKIVVTLPYADQLICFKGE